MLLCRKDACLCELYWLQVVEAYPFLTRTTHAPLPQGPVQSGRVEVQGLRVETRFISGGRRAVPPRRVSPNQPKQLGTPCGMTSRRLVSKRFACCANITRCHAAHPAAMQTWQRA